MALSTLLPRRARRTSAAWLACGALLSVGCSGEVVNLGASPLQAGGSAGSAGSAQGGAVSHVWELPLEPLFPQKDGTLLANPTLTEAGNQLFCSVQQQQGTNPDPNDSHVERAELVGARWKEPVALTLGDAMPDASSPAISFDGGELWLGMNSGSSSTDIYRSVRQGEVWTKPEAVNALNSTFDDVPRQPGFHHTVMPLSSKRHGGPRYQIYLSTRDSNGTWSEPNNALLTNVNAADFQSADGFLTDEGLELYFSSTRDGDHVDSDLYVARRANTEASFGLPEPLVDLNDPEGRSQERMPWLRLDGTQLYFVSDRSGQYTLYVANKVR